MNKTYEEIMAGAGIQDMNPACNKFEPQLAVEDWRKEFCKHCGRHHEKHVSK